MWAFVIAGTIYLMGVGVILMIRPSYMFAPGGDWKEFGIGEREDRYTPFPFWLFCLVWAVVCYFSVLFVMSFSRSGENNSSGNVSASASASKNRRTPTVSSDEGPSEFIDQKLPKGYYVLNKKATKLSGVPKYVYLGEEEPSG